MSRLHGHTPRTPVEQAHLRLIAALRHEDREREDRADNRRALDALGTVVYFIWRPPHIKIGYTSRLSQRLYELHGEPSDVLAFIPGTRADEAAMHERFNAARVWGDGLGQEHFWPSQALIQFINETRAAIGGKPVRITLST